MTTFGTLRSSRTLAAAALACCAAAGMVGCETTARDRYFASRDLVIEAKPGDGSMLASAWPIEDGRRALASADGRTRADFPGVTASDTGR